MAYLDIGNQSIWSLEKVEVWVIKDKKTKNVLCPANKYTFDNKENALKSFYRAMGGKENAQQYLNLIDIVKIGDSDI